VGGRKAKRAEVLRTAKIIRKVAGARPRYFRFPGGCHTRADIRLVASLAEQSVQWDVISGDSFISDPAKVEHEVLRHVQPGSIIVMHLIGPGAHAGDRPAVKALIPKLHARGYHFVRLRKLLRRP